MPQTAARKTARISVAPVMEWRDSLAKTKAYRLLYALDRTASAPIVVSPVFYAVLQIGKDRTVGPVVAATGIGEIAQGVDHALHLLHLALEAVDRLHRHTLDIRALTRPIPPEVPRSGPPESPDRGTGG